MKLIIVIMLISLLSACSSPSKVYQSKYDGHCLTLVEKVKLWKIDGVSNSYYILTNRSEWYGTETLIDEMAPGTKVKIDQVILGESGSYGYFFHVKARIQDEHYVGFLVDLPTPANLNQPSWVTSVYPPDPNILYFNRDIISDCK